VTVLLYVYLAYPLCHSHDSCTVSYTEQNRYDCSITKAYGNQQTLCHGKLFAICKLFAIGKLFAISKLFAIE